MPGDAWHTIGERLDEIEARHECERDATVRFSKRMRLLGWAMIALVAGSAYGGYRLNSRSVALAERNCKLLKKTIIDSGAGGSATTAPRPKKGEPLTAAQAAQRRQEILVGAIVTGLLTAKQRAELVKLSEIIRKAGGVVVVPDCKDPDKTLRVDLRKRPSG